MILPIVLDLHPVICKLWDKFHAANLLDSGSAVDFPGDNGVREAVLVAGDVNGGGFIVIKRDLEDAMSLKGVVNLGSVGLDRDYIAGGVFDGIIYLDEAEDMFCGILVIENKIFHLTVNCEGKIGMALTRDHMLKQGTHEWDSGTRSHTSYSCLFIVLAVEDRGQRW